MIARLGIFRTNRSGLVDGNDIMLRNTLSGRAATWMLALTSTELGEIAISDLWACRRRGLGSPF